MPRSQRSPAHTVRSLRADLDRCLHDLPAGGCVWGDVDLADLLDPASDLTQRRVLLRRGVPIAAAAVSLDGDSAALHCWCADPDDFVISGAAATMLAAQLRANADRRTEADAAAVAPTVPRAARRLEELLAQQ